MRRQLTFVSLVVVPACAGGAGGGSEADRAGPAPVAIVEGLAGPEAVRYDQHQDVYFVSNFNGEAAGDGNGFVARVTPDGVVDSLRFMTGGALAPLHGPRGMFITGDTLWVADAEGVHGFDRRSGHPLMFVDFSPFSPGFLNDIAQGPDGALYVTDTGLSRVYRLAGRSVTIALEDTLLGPPNGITWDSGRGRLLIAPWERAEIRAWRPGDADLAVVGAVAGGRCDGIEMLDGRAIVACQSDSTVHAIAGGVATPLFRVSGRPADIGVDTRRRRVAVPYVALDRVDIWALPRDE